MEPPESQVVVLSTSDANQLVTYYCRIRGYPSLEISWKHNGKEILRNGNKYILNFSRVEDTIFESSFAIQSLDNYDSGNVTCTGTIRPGDGESKTTATAFLSVLGKCYVCVTQLINRNVCVACFLSHHYQFVLSACILRKMIYNSHTCKSYTFSVHNACISTHQ